MIHAIQAGPSPIGHHPLSENHDHSSEDGQAMGQVILWWSADFRPVKPLVKPPVCPRWPALGRWQQKVCWTLSRPPMVKVGCLTKPWCKLQTSHNLPGISHPPLGKQNYWDPIKTWFVHCQVKLQDGKNWRSPTLLQQCPIPIQALLAVSSLAS